MFPDALERRDIFEFSREIAEYLRREKVENLVVVDRSSRPLYVGVREYLMAKYPNEPRPNIFFVNPKGFKAKEDLTQDEIAAIIEDCKGKGDRGEAPHAVRGREEILAEFQEVYRQLMKDREKPVLIFDTCIHSGNSLAPVKRIFTESGFKDVRIGAINPAPKASAVQTDFYVTTRNPEGGCYPFHRDRMVEKTFESVTSRRTADSERRRRGRQLRTEIKSLVKDFLREE